MVLNEVYTGAGLSATMIPETEIALHQGANMGTVVNNNNLLATANSEKSLTWALGDEPSSTRLLVDIYKGCYAKLDKYNASGVNQDSSQTLVITGNIANEIHFGQALSGTSGDLYQCTILAYGAPLYAPSTVNLATNLLADNWLGLVNTITPPTVEAEPKQINLALGGTRNFGFQFKGAETLGEASIDVSLNHGAWLYYALGKMTFTATTGGDTLASGSQNGDTYFHDANNTFHRKEGGACLPPHTDTTATNYKKWDGAKIDYTFTEANSGDLPSFALEITNEKGNTTYAVDTTNTDHFSRIYTGCQINTLTLNFEEGQDVKATVGAVSRKAHDAPLAYIPKRNETSPSELYNYGGADTDNNPYMFSDGTIKLFGQTMARIKSGSVSITNSLTPQRFIGNYDRKITSAHIAGQRLYELNLNLLITDRSIWDELRNQNETTDSMIEIEFAKSDDDKINLKFENYLTTSVDIPFPDDKGPLEVNIIVQPRTLAANGCTYTGKWVIQG